MEDEELRRHFGHLQSQIWGLQIQVTAYRLGLAVLARNHHDLPRLLADFDREVEAAIANYLTTDVAEELVDKARNELEVMRGYLREVTLDAAEGN
jgi:hypothetical protein